MNTFEFEQELHKRNDTELEAARRERDEAIELADANRLIAQEFESQLRIADGAHDVVLKVYEGQIRLLERKLSLAQAEAKIYKSTATRLAGQLSDSKIMKAIEERNDEQKTDGE